MNSNREDHPVEPQSHEEAVVIKLNAVAKSMGSKTLWAGLSFTANRGEVVAITGVSGAGKTTLLNCIGLLERVDAGSVHLGSIDVTGISEGRRRAWYRSRIGFLFQFHGLVDHWTVEQNLAMAQTHSGLGRGARADARQRVLERLGMTEVAKRRVWTLSGGEQQRVALARLMLRSPEIILVDEPTSSLDEGNAQVVMSTLREFADAGSCVVVSTHDPHVVEWADREVSVGNG